MNNRKKYLITIFIKKATAYYSTAASIEKSFELLSLSYPNVTKTEVEELKKKFTMVEYIERISPIIDEIFSEKELEKMIDFYTSETGSKLFDTTFLRKIANAGENMFLDMDEEFRTKNGEKQQKNT